MQTKLTLLGPQGPKCWAESLPPSFFPSPLFLEHFLLGAQPDSQHFVQGQGARAGGARGGAWDRGRGPAQCISAACWWAWGAEERTSRVLSGLCIRFEWWLFLFGTCQPPGQLPAAREGTAWPGVLMYVLPGMNVCVCVCANAHVYAQGGGGASREEPLSACPQ